MFPEGSYGRSIIDGVVIDNQFIDRELYTLVRNAPQYQGCVNIGTPKLELKGLSRPMQLNLIHDVIGTVDRMEFTSDVPASIMFKNNTGEIQREVPIDLIRVIKALAVCAINKNQYMSEVLSTFAVTLLVQYANFGKVSLPVNLPRNNKLQEIVGKELNTWFESYSKEHGIESLDIVSAAKKKVKSLRNAVDVS